MTDPVVKSATEMETLRLGALVLGLHNALHGRDFTDDGPDFTNMLPMIGEAQKAWLEKAEAKLAEQTDDKPLDNVSVAFLQNTEPTDPPKGEKVEVSMEFLSKGLDDEKRLLTAVVLRPDEPDLHDEVYSAEEVEKACHNFNLNCRNANLQHVKQVDNSVLAVVESWVAKADFELGDGQVKKGDWVMTMHVPSEAVWKAVKNGTFTGFSIGCVAEVEELA